jgi:hypothetical protein
MLSFLMYGAMMKCYASLIIELRKAGSSIWQAHILLKEVVWTIFDSKMHENKLWLGNICQRWSYMQKKYDIIAMNRLNIQFFSKIFNQITYESQV